jgi:acetyl-CoA synthetase
MSIQALSSYKVIQSAFRIEDVEAELSRPLESGLNVCYECLDRYAESGKVALYWESQDGRSATYTFAELQALSARFANFLHEQGIRPGDIVAGLLPRAPELMVVALGTLRAGAVYQALFTAFGPKALEYRLQRSGAKMIVTDTVNRPKLDDLATLPTVVTVDAGSAATVRPGDLSFWDEVNRQPATFTPVLRTADEPFLLLFTSGTVGLAKGIAVPIKALLSIIVYMRYGIGLRDSDSFWNVADPGWAYGLYMGVIGALLLGHAIVFYDGPFTAESTYRILAKHGITNLAAAPSAIGS